MTILDCSCSSYYDSPVRCEINGHTVVLLPIVTLVLMKYNVLAVRFVNVPVVGDTGLLYTLLASTVPPDVVPELFIRDTV